MKKRKMSYRTARLVLESAEVQVPVEVDQQYNIVTAMDGIELNPGTMVNVIKVTDKQIEFKVVDTESTYSTDYDTFVTHCQLQSNNVNEAYINEAMEGKHNDHGLLYNEKTNIWYENVKVSGKSFPIQLQITNSKDTAVGKMYDDSKFTKKTIDVFEKETGFKLLSKGSSGPLTVYTFDLNKSFKVDANSKSEVSSLIGKMKMGVTAAIKNVEVDESFVNEALSPADTTRLTAIISNTYAMVNYAHVLHNNDFDAPNVNAVHLALETLYTELPALADELGEACRFDYDITLDHTVVINEANPVKVCFDLRNDLLSLQKDMPGYINSMIDAINGLLTSVMYKMVRLGGLTKPTIAVVNEAEGTNFDELAKKWWDKMSRDDKMDILRNLRVKDSDVAIMSKCKWDDFHDHKLILKAYMRYADESAARGWSEYSTQERLNALKLAIMSDGLAYDAEDYVGKDLKDMPKELQAALEVVTAVNEAEGTNFDELAKKWWDKMSKDDKVKILKKLRVKDSDVEIMSKCKWSDFHDHLLILKGYMRYADESEAQDAYREFFRAKLEEFGAKSPAELSEDQKKDFFNQIKAEWPDAKAEMLNESTDNMVGSIFANYFAKAEDKKKSQVADMLDIEKTATPEQIAKAFDAATSNDQETCCKILSIDESKESDEANKVAFARAYADCNDIKKIQKIDEILLKAGQRVSTSIDVAFAAVKPEIQKQLCSTLGIDWMNESIDNYEFVENMPFTIGSIKRGEPIKVKVLSENGDSLKIEVTSKNDTRQKTIQNISIADVAWVYAKPTDESKQPAKKRSVLAALKYVNEELEVGAELKCLKDLVTTDGTVIPAESTVSYTGIDSNTNVATVTFGENSYAVTIPDLTAATQQMGPAI